jgi:hypothetical protein
MQLVQPVKPLPAHCAHLAAVHVAGAADEVDEAAAEVVEEEVVVVVVVVVDVVDVAAADDDEVVTGLRPGRYCLIALVQRYWSEPSELGARLRA